MGEISVMVIGAMGMLGTDVVRVLHELGVEPIKVDSVGVRQDVVKADISNMNDLFGVFHAFTPTHVVNCAAYTAVDMCETDIDAAFRVNAIGARNVAEVCETFQAINIYISTDYVFDGTKEGEYNEYDHPNPLGVYGATKLQGEIYTKRFDNHYILRTSWMFGKSGKNFVEAIIRKMNDNGALNVVADQMGSPTYSLDLAHVIVEDYIMRADLLPDTYHITNSGFCSWYDLAYEIVKHSKDIGINHEVRLDPILSSDIDRPAPRPKNSVLDNMVRRLRGKVALRHWKTALAEYIIEGR